MGYRTLRGLVLAGAMGYLEEESLLPMPSRTANPDAILIDDD